MEKDTSFSAVFKPEQESNDLASIAGRWNIGVNVKITNPTTITKGTLKIIFLRSLLSESVSEIQIISPPENKGE